MMDGWMDSRHRDKETYRHKVRQASRQTDKVTGKQIIK